jgi:hypothetical protein
MPKQYQHQRNLERLNKKIGLMNVTSPIKKQGGSLRAHTTQIAGCLMQQDRAQDAGRIKPFQRKPAHIKAMEDAKKTALRQNPNRLNNVAAVSVQEASELVSSAQRSCAQLSSELSILAAKTDFNLLDRIVATRGEEALGALRENFDQLNALAVSFMQLLVNSVNNALLRTGSGEVCKSNCIQIKSVVVSLRVIADRISSQPGDVDSASRIVRMVDQGLIEQILSWAYECESAYEVLVPERRAHHKPAHQTHSAVEQQRPDSLVSARQCTGMQTLRGRRHIFVQSRREGAGGPVSSSAHHPAPAQASQRFRHPTPPDLVQDEARAPGRQTACGSTFSHQDSDADNDLFTPYAYSSVPRVCKTMAERRERLQRHRPPMLIIPQC